MATLKSPAVLLTAFLGLGAAGPALADNYGKEFYMLRCATCHGEEGQGTRHRVPPLAPALKGNPFVKNGSPAAIRNVIRHGRSGRARLYDDAFPNMPSFGPGVIPDVDRLVSYLKGDLQK